MSKQNEESKRPSLNRSVNLWGEISPHPTMMTYEVPSMHDLELLEQHVDNTLRKKYSMAHLIKYGLSPRPIDKMQPFAMANNVN